MQATIMTTTSGDRAILTDEHAASSYGQPVLVLDGEWPTLFDGLGGPGVYGPGDMLISGTAAEFTRRYLADEYEPGPPELRSYKWQQSDDGYTLGAAFLGAHTP